MSKLNDTLGCFSKGNQVTRPNSYWITNRSQFKEFCDASRVRPDWHEPDEQGFGEALLEGDHLDNACITSLHEQHVVLQNEDTGIEVRINLAMLLAWARGYDEKSS